MTATALMVQGVCSGAGKSLITTAICRWLSRRGVRVAPFKAQNMSNNARVADGGEIGTAQWLQARACGVAPDVRMNPLLLKPESDTRSQVVLNGVIDHDLTRMPWRGRSRLLWPHVQAAYRSLAHDFEVVVIEGAGSPAETNLWDDDIVNMAVADLADAPVLLVADIDRGGAFAHLYGTWSLLPSQWQRRVEGFLLNKFRGDAALLDPAPSDLTALTGVPMVGVLPMLDHALPAEEGPSTHVRRRASGGLRVAIVTGPYASNLDEFVPLQQAADVSFVTERTSLVDVDLVVLPGSKHVAADRAWLAATGIDREVTAVARAGAPVLGICGGLQLFGGDIADPEAAEGGSTGLALLPLDTAYSPTKTTTRTRATFGALAGPWQWLSERTVEGYEIRLGSTRPRHGSGVVAAFSDRPDLGYAAGNVLGIYLHGIFENPEVVDGLCGEVGGELDSAIDELADALDHYVDTDWLVARATS